MGDGATTEPSSLGQGMFRRIWPWPWPWAAESSFRFCPQVSSRVCCLWASLTPKSLPLSQAHRLPGAAREQLPRTIGGHGAKAQEERGRGPRRPSQTKTRAPRRQRGTRAAQIGARGRPRPGPRANTGARAPGPRTLTRPRRRRRPHRRPGSPGTRVEGHRRPTAPQPRGTAARAPPAARAVRRPPGSRPRAGPAPRGHPTGRSRPPGSPRGPDGSRLPGPLRSRAGSCLSSAGLFPGTPGSASALAHHVRRFWGSGWGWGWGAAPRPE